MTSHDVAARRVSERNTLPLDQVTAFGSFFFSTSTVVPLPVPESPTSTSTLQSTHPNQPTLANRPNAGGAERSCSPTHHLDKSENTHMDNTKGNTRGCLPPRVVRSEVLDDLVCHFVRRLPQHVDLSVWGRVDFLEDTLFN